MSTLGRGAPDYTITVRGDRYVAEPRVGLSELRDSSLSQLWLDINAALSRGPAVKFGTGTFIADDTIEVEYEATLIEGLSQEVTKLKLDAAVNDDLVRNQGGAYYRNTRIQNICLDGNRDNNNAGRGIEFVVGAATGGSTTYYSWVSLNNISITECDNEGLYMETTTGVLASLNMDNFRIWNNDGTATGHQIHLKRVFDSWVGGGGKNAMSSMRVEAMTNSHLHGIYFGGAIDNNVWVDGGDVNYNSCGNIFTNCRFDNALGTALLLDDYAMRNNFIGCSFTNMSQSAATNTYPCVEAISHAAYNNFKGCFFGHNNICTDDRWNYAFVDTASDGYNKLIGCVSGYGAVLAGNAEHFATDEYSKHANSQVIDCYKDNGNAWNA